VYRAPVDNEGQYWQFSTGVRLFSEEWFVKEMGFGMTRAGFRLFCRNLGVPMLCTKSGRFVDIFTFALALRHAMSLGQPNFYAPGAPEIRFNNAHPSYLDQEKARKNMRKVVRELLMAQKFGQAKLVQDTRLAAHRAAELLVNTAVSVEQGRAKVENNGCRD
jgi:hypothetical protein